MSPASAHGEPGHVRFIPLSYDKNDSQKSAMKLILTLFPHWEADEAHIELIRFTDGITNTLLKAVNRRPGLSKAEVDRDAVLLRAYGNGTDVLIDREREAANHELLMKHDLAPELLARFSNGMLYRFIPGAVAQPKDLSDAPILRAIARRLAQWHATVPCVPSPASCRDGSSDGQGSNEAIIAKASAGKPIPSVWTTMQKWILALPTDTEPRRERKSLLQRELEEMIQRLGRRPGLGHDGLVFSHCDLLCANVIIHRDADAEPSVSFIDYEYGTPSPVAFDIANHFSEWAGYNCDYSAIPSRPQRLAFIREYIGAYAKLAGEAVTNQEEETQRLMDEVDLFRGVPGFFWGIWSLIQATISHIDFDYASYAEERLGEYWAFKNEADGSRKASGKEMPLRERRWASNE